MKSLPRLTPLLLFLLALNACKPRPGADENTVGSDLSSDTIPSLYNDSLILSKPTIVFFQPRDEQVDSILSADPEGGIADQNSDFIYYSGLATDSLRNDSMAVMYTNKRFISSPVDGSKPFILDRQDEHILYGMFITNGHAIPLVIRGVKTDQEYIREASDFLQK
jgi:hypothetical protein